MEELNIKTSRTELSQTELSYGTILIYLAAKVTLEDVPVAEYIITKRIDESGCTVTIDNLIVQPEHRRKRIATAILTSAFSMYINSFHPARDGKKIFIVRVPVGKNPIIDRIMFKEFVCELVLDIGPTAYWQMEIV